jgi:hypothetical protein
VGEAGGAGSETDSYWFGHLYLSIDNINNI